MDENATFEARAVLPPRRRRTARLALLVPVVALVAIAWAGVSGNRPDQATAGIAQPTAALAASLPAPSLAVEAPYPAQVVGLAVQRLDAVQTGRLGRDAVIAVAGWYVPTAITDCPPLAALYRPASLPDVRGDTDSFAFCVRSGVLFAARPDLHGLPMNDLEDDAATDTGLPSVGVTVVAGVVVPPELEMVGAGATEVVVVGRFVESGAGCRATAGCSRELVVDHVGWTPGA